MKFARIVPLCLLSLAACKTASTEQAVQLEAPDVHFRKAIIVAVTDNENRHAVEDAVAEEIHRRRPYTQIMTSYKAYPDLHKLTEERFQSYVYNHGIDIVVTIVPFAETVSAGYDDWTDVAGDELVPYVEKQPAGALVGRYGVQLVAWDVKTKRPVYAKTSQILVGELAGPNGVAEFAAATVTTER